MHDEKSDMVTHRARRKPLAAFEPHDEKGGSGVEAEAGKAAVEGTSVKLALRDRRSRPHMNAMRVDIVLVFGIEQLELAAA